MLWRRYSINMELCSDMIIKNIKDMLQELIFYP